MHTTVKFAKVRKNATIPTKRKEDAGYDVYLCFDEDYIIIEPHTTKMLPTGIASACDKNYCFILKERGSTGSAGLAQRCGVIDSGYRGEWFVPITNTTNYDIIIYKGKKPIKYNTAGTLYPCSKAICQALIIPVPTVDIEEYTYDELKKISSIRQSGNLGSSNK